MVEERAAAVSKVLLYLMGVTLLICGVALVWLTDEFSGDFFDFSRTPPVMYMLIFGSLIVGLFAIWRGSVFARREKELKERPVVSLVATVERMERHPDGRMQVIFQNEKGERLHLWQRGSCRYIEGDRGHLEYKGDEVLHFVYDP